MHIGHRDWVSCSASAFALFVTTFSIDLQPIFSLKVCCHKSEERAFDGVSPGNAMVTRTLRCFAFSHSFKLKYAGAKQCPTPRNSISYGVPHFLAIDLWEALLKIIFKFLSQPSQWNVTRASSCDHGSFLNGNVEVPQEIGCHLMSVVAAFFGFFLASPTQVIVAWPYKNREWLKYWVVQASLFYKTRSVLWTLFCGPYTVFGKGLAWGCELWPGYILLIRLCSADFIA